jgi:hypothetical protein
VKCSRLAWCDGMAMALRGVPENSEARGMSISRGWIGDEERARLIGVTYHVRARDQGLILNFCPWCGVRIRFDETPSSKGSDS